MSHLEWFPLYVPRFLNSRRLRRMSAKGIGIYTLLICEEWDGGPIPDDDAALAFLARCDPSDARAVLEVCFSLTSDGWINPELEEIRAEQEEKRSRYVEAGRKGGEAKARNASSDAKAMLKQPSTNRVEESRKETNAQVAFEGEFLEFWEKYPNKVGKKDALEKWQARRREGISAKELMAGLDRYLAFIKVTDRYVKNPKTFLGPGRHWEEPWEIPEGKKPEIVSELELTGRW